MGKIVISTNMTLDGVVQDPDGKEGFAHGGWFNQFGAADLELWAQLATDEALHADALLLGRRSDEWFAQRWLARSGSWADRLNDMPKYIVSSSPAAASWSNATVISGDVVPEVARLKETSGEILVYASYHLGRTLLDHGLVDELRLFVFPVVLGAGDRLFTETAHPNPLRLVDNRTIGTGLNLVTYEIVR